MTRISIQEKPVRKHRKKCRRNAQVQDARDTFFRKPRQSLDQRKIRFRQGLEKPVFFEKTFIMRISHERQMCVQQQVKLSIAFRVHASAGHSVRLITTGTIVVGKSPSLSVAKTGIICVESGRSCSKENVPSGLSGNGSPRTWRWASGRVPP